MKCPFCAEDINDGAVICRHCGKKLHKSPAVAAILNFFFWGAGYMYCGRQWGVAILIPFILVSFYALSTGLLESPPDLLSVFIANIPGFLMAWHAYKMAKEDTPRSSVTIRETSGLGRDVRRLEEKLAGTKDPAHRKELQALLHDWKERQYLITGYIALAVIALVILIIIIYLAGCAT